MERATLARPDEWPIRPPAAPAGLESSLYHIYLMPQPHRFAPHVHVYGARGLLYVVHPAQAARLLAGGSCQPRKTRGGKVRELTLLSDQPRYDQAGRYSGAAPRPATPPRITCYMGQRYTRVAHLRNAAGQLDHQCYEFRPIHSDDAPLFRLSVTDCLI